MTATSTALVLCPETPYPPTDGGRLRMYHLITQLALAARVDVLALGSPDDAKTDSGSYPPLEQVCRRVDSIPTPLPGKDLKAQLARTRYCLTHRISPRADIYSGDDTKHRMTHILAGRTYDLVLVEHEWLAHLLPTIQQALRRCGVTVLDLHNVESELRKEFAKYSDGMVRSPLNRIFAYFALKYEQHWLPMFDHLLTPSDVDLRKLSTILHRSGRPFGGGRISVIPNGVDVEFYRAIGPQPWERKRLLFCGGLDYPPNRTAVSMLARRILPRIRKYQPRCELWIVGKDDPGWKKPQAEGVIFTGYVADIRPYLDQSAMVLAPILNGSGTRLKALESWAARRPLIATAKAVEGLQAVPMVHFWEADSARAFADAVRRIFREPRLATAMVESAYQFAAQQYDWNMIGRRLRQTIDDLVRGRAQAGTTEPGVCLHKSVSHHCGE